MSSYDIANDILNTARVRLNSNVETLLPVGGDLLQNTQPFTQQAYNSAWRRFQEELVDLGFPRFEEETVVTFPALTNIDPSVQCWIDWDASYNGSALSAPILPADFIAPLKLWERNAAYTDRRFADMDQQYNGLPSVTKRLPWNLIWEWRQDKIYFPGSRIDMQLRIRYASYLPDFINDEVNRVEWFKLPVPVMRCQNAMACFLCAEICAAREQLDWVTAFTTEAKDATQRIFNRDTAEPRRVAKPSERGKQWDGRKPPE